VSGGRKPTPAAIARGHRPRTRTRRCAGAQQLAQALLDLGWDVSLKRPKWWLAEQKRKAKEAGLAKSAPSVHSASFVSRTVKAGQP
jgi:hypothetical protein